MKLKDAVDSYMKQVPEVKTYCERCLRTERWDGSIVLMIVDAAFTSIGLNYFLAVVPKVDEFRKKHVEPGNIHIIEDLASVNEESLMNIWQNKRSWHMAKSVAYYLAQIKKQKGVDDKKAFIHWAQSSSLENWQENPIGQIKGVGINTFQYLRMMGGIDTVMPDKIVKRVITEMLGKAGVNMTKSDIDFVKQVELIAQETGHKAIELCWMTWLIQSEAGMSRMAKYSAVLPQI